MTLGNWQERKQGLEKQITSRERVRTALRHEEPDRVPVDFLATPEIWHRLVERMQPDIAAVGNSEYFDPTWEAILQELQIDLRTLSYDQFCNPPQSALHADTKVSWWEALSRSLPNRMWRQSTRDGDFYDIWGRHFRVERVPTGAYEALASFPLGAMTTLEEVKQFPWPAPDWWDFGPLPDVLQQLDAHEEYHLRFRIGSIFEVAWQLYGMEKFLVDLAMDPTIPLYIMERLTDVYVEITRRALEAAKGRLDMVYFYDDVATQESLLMSRRMWSKVIRPRHEQLIEVAKSRGVGVMYHCDGAIAPLIPELIDMGIDLLNPVQADAAGMDPAHLKAEFGDRLSFHGGIDIIQTLPKGTPEAVRAEVRERIDVLGRDGGYILASSHHIQSDTPLENVFAMYDLNLRYRDSSR